jgi:hypothetical protein
MMSDDQSAIYNSLRASTAAMLGYSEIDQLTAAQEIRLSRAISLRLIVDTAQAAQLCGRPIDVRTFTDASESLEKLCGGQPDAPNEARRFSGEHQARLRRLIERTVLAPSATDHVAIAERQWREEQQALAAALPDWTWKPLAAGSATAASGDASDSGALPPPPSRAPAGDHPLLVEPPPPAQTSNQPPLPKRGEIPAHYLKQDEPWRQHLDADGNIVAPYFQPR